MTAIRQSPGWWAALCRAECDECGWVGPTRDTSDVRGTILVKIDAGEHHCRCVGRGW